MEELNTYERAQGWRTLSRMVGVCWFITVVIFVLTAMHEPKGQELFSLAAVFCFLLGLWCCLAGQSSKAAVLISVILGGFVWFALSLVGAAIGSR